MPQPVLTLDGRRCDTLAGFFAEAGRVVCPGVGWGHNLDAFHDVLRGGFGTPAGGFTLVWAHSAASRVALGYPETVRQLEQRVAHCHPTNRAAVAADLGRAHAGVGPTVFDWLVDIIHAHAVDGVELVLA